MIRFLSECLFGNCDSRSYLRFTKKACLLWSVKRSSTRSECSDNLLNKSVAKNVDMQLTLSYISSVIMWLSFCKCSISLTSVLTFSFFNVLGKYHHFCIASIYLNANNLGCIIDLDEQFL